MLVSFAERLNDLDPRFTKFASLNTIQLNLGNLCNQLCTHCHLNASPSGTHIMQKAIIDKAINFISGTKDKTLDITGGCPEMNPNFRYFIEATDGLSPRRILRSNLTICREPGMEWLPHFYHRHRLVIIASLPCYLEENVDSQRGHGIYKSSIDVLKELNALGYGNELELNLVYNPGGDFIPGSQRDLESTYKQKLLDLHGIRFNSLYAITNAPIGRFKKVLEQKGTYDRYLQLLAARFNPAAAENIMCRTLVSIDWQGYLYNCDFNQALELPIRDEKGVPLTIERLEEAVHTGKRLRLENHCYCCTAGEGSSCTGALAA